MGPQGKSVASGNSMQRVKVYRLNNEGKWDDQGTGHVTVDYLEGSEDLALFVIDEEDDGNILVHRISSEEIYRRQEDTIISWRELSTELALSFQESMGCSYIWDHICSVQRNMHFNSISSLEMPLRPANDNLESAGASHANDEPFPGVSGELQELPPVELSTLPLLVKSVAEGCITDQIRVAELIAQDRTFVPKLTDLFRVCEDLENVDGLRLMYKVVKGIISLNSPPIFERIFGDDYIMDIIGALEYDPEVPQVQHHRAFLKEHVVFKEAIPIKDPSVLSKIHQTYRVGYIKDVILPRALDEATIANLNSIVHSNNAYVVSLLKDDNAFIQELFARLRSPATSVESKKNLVLFLQEFCSLSKSLQLVHQMRLFRDLVTEGLFDIITDILQSEDKALVLTGTDILIIVLNQDPNLLRAYIIQQEGHTLLGLLVKGMITDFGEDMHCQFLEIIRILLDSYTMSGSQRDTIVEIFYDKYMDQLIDVVASSCCCKGSVRTNVKSTGLVGRVGPQSVTKPDILSNICELLCFCVLHHPYRIKCNFLHNNVIEKVLYLTRRKEKYLVVAAVRFLRTIISRNNLQDEFLLRHIVKHNLLKPVVEVFVANGNRYNLLHSAVLELFEYIRKENLKSLILYSVECFWDQLEKFEHLDTFRALKLKYEQSMESCQPKNPRSSIGDPRKRIDERALEKEEEDYFNEDSDEEDSTSARISNSCNQPAASVLINGDSTNYSSFREGSVGLVDYEDDEEEDEDGQKEVSTPHDMPPDSPTSKRKMEVIDHIDQELPTKKHRTKKTQNEIIPSRDDKTLNDTIPSRGGDAACSNCGPDQLLRKKAYHQNLNGSHDVAEGQKEPVAPSRCSNCSANNSFNLREASEEEPSPLTNQVNSSSLTDGFVNVSKITGSGMPKFSDGKPEALSSEPPSGTQASEPYSVR
ncbi:serine/threonine-protein phosphatase 4 regulatory subunit 3 isoform X1 [Amborella trichopoda]|uniref:serine/threonine-protein phosphatase 4 regulatory subunit 3 isoform X1 n=1 Tax=Amborella trichopoda TaxID=13333 RepID=UPI0009BF5DFD|nr:serine/threonine-protein phosphatase 4 regulatory subunit 3 isoform X1 [Amborella trichopoda]|eukprot:XP_020521251.1 serine/threonine-protein phosphatase 4 regulatory subunit 3 isoform X1 [Amborella trichopoda]